MTKVEEIQIPPQIVTDHLAVIEKELEEDGISISHTSRLSLEEVIEHMISLAVKLGPHRLMVHLITRSLFHGKVQK